MRPPADTAITPRVLSQHALERVAQRQREYRASKHSRGKLQRSQAESDAVAALHRQRAWLSARGRANETHEDARLAESVTTAAAVLDSECAVAIAAADEAEALSVAAGLARRAAASDPQEALRRAARLRERRRTLCSRGCSGNPSATSVAPALAPAGATTSAPRPAPSPSPRATATATATATSTQLALRHGPKPTPKYGGGGLATYAPYEMLACASPVMYPLVAPPATCASRCGAAARTLVGRAAERSTAVLPSHSSAAQARLARAAAALALRRLQREVSALAARSSAYRARLAIRAASPAPIVPVAAQLTPVGREDGSHGVLGGASPAEAPATMSASEASGALRSLRNELAARVPVPAASPRARLRRPRVSPAAPGSRRAAAANEPAGRLRGVLREMCAAPTAPTPPTPPATPATPRRQRSTFSPRKTGSTTFAAGTRSPVVKVSLSLLD